MHVYEAIVTSSFRSCKNVEELDKEREKFIWHLNSAANIIYEDIIEDEGKFRTIFNNSESLSANEIIALNNDMMNNLAYERLRESIVWGNRIEFVNILFEAHLS